MRIFKNKQNKEEVVVESIKDLETPVVTEKEIKEEKSSCKCDKQFSHSDISEAICNLIHRYDIANTWVAESLNDFGIALHEELDNMNTK